MALSLRALVNHRDYHGTTRAAIWQPEVSRVEGGLRISAFSGAQPLYLYLSPDKPEMQITVKNEWWRGYFKDIEAERGQEPLEDHLLAVELEYILQPGETICAIACTNTLTLDETDFTGAYARHQQHQQTILQHMTSGQKPAAVSPIMARLALAADQFIVRRGDGHSVIAGYPWFTDWGRDTMIALPGLTLSTGRPEVAASILRTFARYVDQGMLPNRFPDEGETPEYNTVDATLWYFEAIRAYYEITQDKTLLAELFPVLREIIEWHRKGTRYSIHVDPADGLLYAGEQGVQLTWMDVKIGDWVVTPRTGKPVEINALWYNALMTMREFAWVLNERFGDYLQMAERVKASFSRFWNGAYCYDVLDTTNGHDATLRPNQLFAVSLHHSPMSLEQQKAIVEVCARYLLTPHGLRSLSRDDEAYHGIYIGDPFQRDSTYHQGTVWGWLIGPFVQAHLRVYRDKAAARGYLDSLLRHLDDHGLGTISEIFDGDAPYTPRGCFAQAWSVAEVLRVWRLTEK
jgi:predicted glycogen debranching enzyme